MKDDRIDPELLDLLKSYTKLQNSHTAHREEALRAFGRKLGLVWQLEKGKPPRVMVVIECAADSDLTHLTDSDLKLNQTSGTVRTGYVTLDRLESLSDDPAVLYIHPSHPFRPQMDVAAERVKVPAFRNTHGNGRGVVVGIVDSGIDGKHPAFQGRIQSVWDQIEDGVGPPILNGRSDYGVELTGGAVSQAVDLDGHGTHVAGIACGNDAQFPGVASDATVVVVRTDYFVGHVIDAMHYILKKADELGAAAVVNLSLGSHKGPHDGTDEISRAIDELTGAGRIFCCAAGNDGDNNIHARFRVTQGEVKSLRFDVPDAAALTNGISEVGINGWYSGSDQLRFALQSPDQIPTEFHPAPRVRTGTMEHPFQDLEIKTFSFGRNQHNGDHRFHVRLRALAAGGGRVTPGAWELLLDGIEVHNGIIDLWTLDDSDANGQDITFEAPDVDDGFKIASPGAAKRAITIGSFTTRIKWTDFDGNNHEDLDKRLGQVSNFSASGPLRDRHEKPDIVAPGAVIISARSQMDQTSNSKKVSEHHRVNSGTSMSCPFVAGLVAVMLRGTPNLTPELAKQRLRQASHIPSQPPGSFDPAWGHGLIDASKL